MALTTRRESSGGHVALPQGAAKAAMVEAMFDRIAPRYDLMNRLLTLRLDQRWRRLALAEARLGRGDTLVDLGCGTGDMCELAAAVGARVIGVDFAAGMLREARRRRIRADFVRADASAIPLRAASVTVLTCTFVLRNLVSITAVLTEAARVVRSRGRLAILEVDEPSHAVARAGHALYFRRVVPLLGALLSDRHAYAYLPQSTSYLPPQDELLGLLREAGFPRPLKRRLGGGAAQLIVAERSTS